ncbi:MAG: DEAD/DEAH box helicase family protein, partial [Candidatus Liptonbacteria bacterium]|nr:DEAD/DEAH box helicase family protein [Candidatus Liptonbacteria bacterium]
MFTLQSPFTPRGDQPNAIETLANGLERGAKHQTLLGVTGSGKTYTMASVIARAGLPTLVISPNKTLAAQLYQEFRAFFPHDEVHYFVSYYDYYQPEAYIPHTNTYIQKDARINKDIDRLRHAALQTVMTKRNVIVISSVSCIYGLGDPEDYRRIRLELAPGQRMTPARLTASLSALRYLPASPPVGGFKRGKRTEAEPKAGEFRKTCLPAGRAVTIHIHLVTGERVSIAMDDGVIKNMRTAHGTVAALTIYPAQFWITPEHKLSLALENIKRELADRVEELQSANRFAEAERLEQRTRADIETIAKNGTVPGIENYSRHLSFRDAGQPPHTLIDYFPKD